MTWAQRGDLIIGDAEIGTLDATYYLDLAETEMNTYLGQVYVLPLVTNVLLDHQLKTLKNIQTHIATGYLLMAQSATAENEDLHAYGMYLLQTGQSQLNAIGTSYELTGQTRADATGEDRRASITTADATSPFDAFGEVVFGGGGETLDWSSTGFSAP